MQDKLKAFEALMSELATMINRSLAEHPELSEFRLDMLTVKPAAHFTPGTEEHGSPEKAQFKLTNDHLAYHNCRICVDRNGNEYCYFGTNGCPVYH